MTKVTGNGNSVSYKWVAGGILSALMAGSVFVMGWYVNMKASTDLRQWENIHKGGTQLAVTAQKISECDSKINDVRSDVKEIKHTVVGMQMEQRSFMAETTATLKEIRNGH